MTGSAEGSPTTQAGAHLVSDGARGGRRRSRGVRRQLVERNIYRSRRAGREVYEVGYRDSAGKQRWVTVQGGITAARRVRADVLGRKARGEQIRPNPRLRFDEAAEAWREGQVADLRPATQKLYWGAYETHLAPRFGRRRLDAVTVDDLAQLVRALRADGKSEATIVGVLKVARRIFKYASRRMGYYGANPLDRLEESERPKPSAAPERRIYRAGELAQTLAAAQGQWRVLFTFATVTGARLSECLGLRWQDIDLDDTEAASATFSFQVDRRGQRQPLKTEESRRTIELPRQLAVMLLEHRLTSFHSGVKDFVFASRTGRALTQRNVMRVLRTTQRRAADERGRPTFPALQELDAHGKPLPPPRGAVPSFHSFRHTAASEAIAAGESAEEVAWQLGHRNSVVTRTVYIQEIKSAERRARRRARLEARYCGLQAGEGPELTASSPEGP